MKLNQDFNFHSHTKRCGHARGEDEGYVLAAMDTGFTDLGFSDHIMLPGLSQPGIRGDYNLFEDYLHSVGVLQEKYKGKIRIYKAFECEWYGELFREYYRDLLVSKKVDYLILGQHCYFSNGFVWYGRYAVPTQGTEAYLHDLIQGMESGFFLYVAHPDTFMSWHKRFDEQAYQVAKEIATKAKELDIPLEVNMGPSRWYIPKSPEDTELPYPNRRFWEVVAEVGAPCVFGVDAHEPQDYFDSDFGYFNDFAKDLGLRMVDVRKKLKK